MSVMKTSLAIIPMCPRELLSHCKKFSRLILFYIKDWATLLHFIYFIYFLLVTIYLITKLSITYWGSPGLGDVWMAGLRPLAGLPDYEDTRLKTPSRVRMGLSLAWKASLAMRIFKISYHCNQLCVTLTLFGVYINQRVLVRRTTTSYNNHTIG